MGAAWPLPQAEVPPENHDQSSKNVTGNSSSSKSVDSSQVQSADVASTPDSRSSSELIDVVPAKGENVDGTTKGDQSSNNVTQNSTSSKTYDSSQSQVQRKDAANTSNSLPSSELIGAVPAEDENEGGTTEAAEQEEEGECGFCLFMKGGECKESFLAWERCVEEAEKGNEDLGEKCFEVTSLLRQCMEANSSYYAPILRAEKSVEEEASKAMEEEAAIELELAALDENVDGTTRDDQTSNNVTENSTSSKPYDSSQVQPADAANTSDSRSSPELGVVPGEDENDGGTTEDAEQEEEGECGFCLFMKGGECKESFIAWEKCVDEAEAGKEDLAQKCFEVTSLLRQCMEANSGYYAPILQVEKSLEEEAASELEKAAEEKPSKASGAAEERNNTE